MRVLLAYDDSSGARTARDLVANLDLPDRSTITLATALEQAADVFGAPGFGPAATAEADAMLIQELQQILLNASAPFRPRYRVDCRVLRGRPAPTLLAEAELTRPDLIVVGSRGHGPYASILLGSVSTELVDHAECPVLVARRPRVSRLVVATDGSDSAVHAMDVLAQWSSIANRPALVTSIAPSEDVWTGTFGPAMVREWPSSVEDLNREAMALAEQNAEAGAARLSQAGLACSPVVRRGDPADQIIAVADAHDADLIVVGSRGLGTWSRLLLGSIARKVVQHARQSVLVIRQSPVTSPTRPQVNERVPAGV